MNNNILKEYSDHEEKEIKLLLEGLFIHHGFDFRDYSFSSLKRRIMRIINSENLESISELQERILHDPNCLKRFVYAIPVNVTTMFRDPGFFITLRKKVIPELAKNSFNRIWVAGCSTGEEVYSLAILLEEAGIYNKCKIYATDINDIALKKAKQGIYHLKMMKEYTTNYIKSGGESSFSEYYTTGYDHSIFRSSLKRNLIFAHHNLLTDKIFNHFDLILCRNVMIYFNQAIKHKAKDLLHNSLYIDGFLGLGRKESINFNSHELCYKEIENGEKLYKRIF